MAIDWNESYCVGHPVIDRDHKRLFQIVGKFNTCPDAQSLRAILPELMQYADEHFRIEEDILASVCTDQRSLRAHCAGHEVLKRNLRNLTLSVQSIPLGMNIERFISEAIALTEMWIFNHVVNDDQKLVQLLGAQRAE